MTSCCSGQALSVGLAAWTAYACHCAMLATAAVSFQMQAHPQQGMHHAACTPVPAFVASGRSGPHAGVQQ
jgi:hypothetical protein